MGVSKNWTITAKPLQLGQSPSQVLHWSAVSLSTEGGKKKKVSSSRPERAGTEQREESLSHKAKGLSGMWFQRKSPSRDCLIGN